MFDLVARPGAKVKSIPPDTTDERLHEIADQVHDDDPWVPYDMLWFEVGERALGIPTVLTDPTLLPRQVAGTVGDVRAILAKLRGPAFGAAISADEILQALTKAPRPIDAAKVVIDRCFGLKLSG
jgi:hypothetical protein